ncbi:quinone-dependent dihydroorotate dehydrogenase [Hyphomicrobium sp.]|uniref:quinone-dependent dihydroorotate dehydrogenase n=1 Tax=Hyphomicrobium sp. TaxID=82 RepID=UPI0025BAE527|nr:quinone-dependent dihydroorotate dehydrogenase [Hyphomicrobium sp.]MCC7252327.1 quinone-dependent dihydroorotate dehydrogenase [Hyphomicrobium sp.]
MIGALSSLAHPLLLALEPETAHELTLRALELGVYPRCGNEHNAVLETSALGLIFPNPVGVAAGFDKDARVPDALLGLGCGFAEIGTTTPKPQAGNPKPRVFRLIPDRAVINRLGFNNAGHAAALARLKARATRGVVGVHIGANKESPDRAGDYVAGLQAFYDVASYFTVNISSPNTPGLRDLQAPDALDALLSRIMAARAEKIAESAPRRPIVVKLAPDLEDDAVEPVISALVRRGMDGIAVSNTTLDRTGLTDPAAEEAGGLSGRPLFHRSTVMLARVYRASEGKVPLIGIGGIDSPESALSKIEAGASLLQLYTGLIYEGPGLIGRINDHLAQACRERGVKSITELTGIRAAEWAAKAL